MSGSGDIEGKGDAHEIDAWAISMPSHDLSKALLDGDDEIEPSSQLSEAEAGIFAENGALEPPNSPEALARLYEMSSALRPNIQAIANNVDGFGHRIEERLNTDPEKRRRQVEDALIAERLDEFMGDEDIDDSILPSADDVDDRLSRIELLMRIERLRINSFFGFCCSDMSFPHLRMITRQDLEIFGYGFWEVLRTGGTDGGMGRIARFVHVPAMTCRLLPQDALHVDVPAFEPISDIEYRPVTVKRRFRRFIQVSKGKAVFFKEFGDPRVTSRETGKRYTSVEAMRSPREGEGPGAMEAHELIHFKIDSPRSPYGMPRWIGAMPAVLGGREAEEVNLLYFNNKSVPPMAILVQGGKLSDGAVNRIKEHISKHIKGKQNFHDILVLEGESADGNSKKDASPSRVRIDIKTLSSAQLNDAQFLKYTERSQETVGAQFSLPPIMRGMMRDFNRSTADAALRYAEIAVFEPLRQGFDFFMNLMMVRELGVRFWRFVSNAPVNRDPKTMSTMVKDLSNAGTLTPEDGRRLAADIFNEDLPRIDEPWVKRPLQLTVAGVSDDGGNADILQQDACQERMVDVLERLAGLMEQMRSQP